ncbi:MAG TPA: heme ABC exporter ATP-binding protein CcmA [Actinomycetota bacterium]|nr:heme ABC exporter ATP-binding protein CcmA [Actinomycetota bacterium]
MTEAMVRLHGVEVAFGRTLALHGMTIDLFPGVIGLFGPNGSGKSTLLSVLAGLLRPTAGTAEYRGRPIRSSDEEWRRVVGYAGHEPGLYPSLTVAENLELWAQLFDAPGRRVGEMIERLGLGERRNTQVRALSAGYKRRASVARALLHEPAVLLLDEPYANLDDEAAAEVSAAIVEWRRPDRLAVVATHGAKKVKAYADAGIILKHGAVVSYRRGVEQLAPPVASASGRSGSAGT